MRAFAGASHPSILSGALSLIFAACVPAGELELLQKSTVDSKALTFASGSATRFGNVVNGRTHQQWPLTTYRGYQYVTWFDAARRVCIGRRKLPSGPWEVIRFNDHRFKTNDSHNTAVLGICRTDGTIHMAFDHHATPLNYRISQLGAAHRPDSVRWDASLFSGVLHTLGSVKPHDRVTYPRFFNAPNGNLMFYYRAVTSADGDGMIEEYNGDKHDWTPGLGKFIARDLGVFKAGGKSSKSRCPYMDSLSYAGDRLHATWGWRDRFDRTNARHNHSLCHAYSDDHGRTWHNSDGRIIGTTGKSPIHLDSPGLVVAPIPVNSGLSNQNSHYAYPDGSIHVMLLRLSEKRGERLYHHHWRTPEGEWKSEELPFSGNRPTLVGKQDRSLILAYTNGREQLQLARGIPDSKQNSWKWTKLRLPSSQSTFGDPPIDFERWQHDGVLSIYCQEEPRKILRTRSSKPVDGLPSPLHVIDYRLRDSAGEGE